jgi:hypothetical protein
MGLDSPMRWTDRWIDLFVGFECPVILRTVARVGDGCVD